MSVRDAAMPKYANLMTGDPAPWFQQRSYANPRYAFDTAGGRYLVLCFLARGDDGHAQAALAACRARPDIFDDRRVSFFGVSVDPADEREHRLVNSYPGFRMFWDFDLTASRLYGAAPVDAEAGGGQVAMRRLWAVIDPTMRMLRVIPFAADRSDISDLLAFLDSLPPPSKFAGFELQAPIVFLPNVFEPELCARLIDLYETHGGEDSGFMREVDGRTVAITDYGHKRRRDHTITDQKAIEATRARVVRRIVPELRKVHQFEATRMERYIVACYDATEEAHFRPHRDNTTKGTAHRRFAVSINLNEDFDGGDISFPEYGPRSFRPPPGGAVVFSCSLLHAVSTVTRGRRFVFLPFLYDEPAADLRQRNLAYVGPGEAEQQDPATTDRENGEATGRDRA